MNREKFKHIARSSKTPDTTDIVDLVEITKEFPYFSWGFALLAKIYSEREDFRTETLMHQAALRVSDREWLYNYIHGNSETTNKLESTNTTVTTDVSEYTSINEISNVEVIANSSENSKVPEITSQLESINATVTTDISENTSINEISNVEEISGESHTAVNEGEVKIEASIEVEEPTIEVEAVNDIESADNIQSAIDVESKTKTIAEPLIAEATKSTPTLEELKSAFLKSELETNQVEENLQDFNQNEEVLKLDHQNEEILQDFNQNDEIQNLENQKAVIDQVDIQNNELTIEATEESESSLFFPVIEFTDVTDSNTSDSVFTPSTFEPEITSPETKKSKGYYNIEDYYTLPPEAYNQYQFKASSKENEPKIHQQKNSTNDFYSWLNSDIPQNAPAVKPVERREDLLDKFLKNKPLPSRPKQEFYSPEKAGKRSDTLSNQIVTETLANIYYKQGNFSKAIEAYQQLQLKFPEKLSYFANLIEKIKKESIS